MALNTSSPEETYRELLPRLQSLMPEFEIRIKSEQVFRINQLKREKNAVVLGHNYMEPALYHGVADIVGDSLQLSRAAATMQQDPIVFCGVRFMAETAKVLNPSKTVLLPSARGGCSLAASITAADVRALKERYPNVPVVVYINTYSDVHAEADSVCTSSNAAKVVSSFKSDTVIFLPDEFLAKNIARETGKHIIIPELHNSNAREARDATPVVIGWHGKCEVHEQFTVDDITAAREQFPDVLVLAHPECPPAVVEAADFSGSTSKMAEKVRSSNASRYLLLTECSMADNIIAENKGKEVLRLCHIRCPHMAEITLEDTYNAIAKRQYAIEVPEETRVRAKRALDYMLSIN